MDSLTGPSTDPSGYPQDCASALVRFGTGVECLAQICALSIRPLPLALRTVPDPDTSARGVSQLESQ